MSKMTRLTSLILTSLLVSVFANAEPRAQTPEEDAIPEPVIVLSELTGNIILKNGESPETSLQLLIENESDESYSGVIGFAGADTQQITVAAGESTTITLPTSPRHAGKIDQIQKAEVDLSLLLDNAPAPAISSVDIDIQIPEAAFPMIRSEPPAMEKSAEEEFQYEDYARSQQLQPIKFTYNPGPVNLQVRKTVYPIPVETGPVEISIEVVNHGSQATSELILRDALDDTDFSGAGDNFTRFVSEDGTELIWERTLKPLAPGERRRINYTVTAKYAVGDKQLPATTVIMDDELTGLSNKVWLPKWH
ncbi:MAG: hypothetical protein VYD52_06830 [Pseudomonadota bacterium]|nr:hypothetical protein [Pseudomonadota bacterium]